MTTTRLPESDRALGRDIPGSLVTSLVADFKWHLTTGEVAELRRMGVAQETRCAAYWKLVVSRLEPAGVDIDTTEAQWAVTLATMAALDGLHGRNRRLGAALADAGVSEARFLRLLRARGVALSSVLRAAVHQIVSAGERVDWGDIAQFVLSGDDETSREPVRRRIARDYYRQVLTTPDRR